MGMSMTYGYTVTDIDMGNEKGVEIDLRDDGKVALTKDQHTEVMKFSNDSTSYRDNVLRVKAGAKAEWAEERGPDSELGRGIEAGTPSTDHSSDSDTSPRDSQSSVPQERSSL